MREEREDQPRAHYLSTPGTADRYRDRLQRQRQNAPEILGCDSFTAEAMLNGSISEGFDTLYVSH
jgi:hypothetical protein